MDTYLPGSAYKVNLYLFLDKDSINQNFNPGMRTMRWHAFDDAGEAPARNYFNIIIHSSIYVKEAAYRIRAN